MDTRHSLFGLPPAQAIGLLSFMLAVVSIWVHLEICLAEVNVEIVNLKQELFLQRADNRKEFETMQTGISTDTREVLRKIDEIQIYLRDRKR